MPRVNLNSQDREQWLFSSYIRGRLRTEKKKQSELADYMGMTQQNLSQKMVGKIAWTLRDMVNVCDYFEEPYVIGERYGR